MRVFLFGIKIKDAGDVRYAGEILAFAQNQGWKVCTQKSFYKELAAFNIALQDCEIVSNRLEMLAFAPELAITFGGDGTLLQVATWIQDSRIPVLGINLGRLGFLASVEKYHVAEALTQIALGQYHLEHRSMLALQSNLQLFVNFPYALNDFTLHKRDNSSMITIYVYVGGQLLNAYWADGIIISTPTGSTGYSLSCGGPIVFPSASNFIITPVAPHNLNVRPIVLSDANLVSFRVEGRSDNFMCTLDGRYETVTAEHVIEITKAPFTFEMVRLQGQNFMKTMSEKLSWGMDKRN